MILPLPGDFIDIHTHGSQPVEGVFSVENVMAHEGLNTGDIKAAVFSAGIHPWYLNPENKIDLLSYMENISSDPRLLAIGEAGFDKLRGPSPELQRSVFARQAAMAEERKKPLFIHCVRAWDELLDVHKSLRPSSPWMVHGFRGKKELARQLTSRGMYLSFWFDFIIRSESSDLIRSVPRERIFIETDGADTDIRIIYGKVASDIGVTTERLKEIINENFRTLAGLNELIR
ncbi:MAG: TatD family hydrolase [Bacteroidales bacterium]|jgi:TatD DNase family protein|nr:TatD family hydrolase [Bacteroidales bacterium]